MKTKTILIQPVVSEKGFTQAEEGIYTFRVAKNANKHEIKKAVESTFEVTVVKVRTLVRKGKTSVDWTTRRENKRKNFKIAYVKLKSGDEIEFVTS
jgi:large subunit ribosomal protein L23